MFEYELKDMIDNIEKNINLSNFNKSISCIPSDDIIIFNKIQKLISSPNEKEIIRYCFNQENSSIYFSTKMCVIEFNKNANQSFFQNIIKDIIKYMIKNYKIYLLNVFLINNNNVLFEDEQILNKYIKLFNNVPGSLDKISYIGEKNLDRFTDVKVENSLSNAQLKGKDYLYFSFTNKVQIDFSYISYHKDDKKAEEELFRLESIIKECFEQIFQDLKEANIITYENFKIIGGI
jgi:hypothetical protein